MVKASQRRLAAVCLALVALSGQWDEPRGTPEQCAERLGIAWTVADGATERLDSFERCTR